MTLNEKIKFYLSKNKINYSSNDYVTMIPHGQEDQIVEWNTEKLGPIPTQEQLDAAGAIGEIESMAEQARGERNTKLASSDWTQMPDYSGADKAAWATYRQALRDVPQQAGFPENITWPVAPA